jgi:type II secretory pathway pseudopilin PulG
MVITRQKLRRARRTHRAGYTLIEALLLVTMLGIVAAGVGTSMSATANSTQSNDNTLQIDNTLVSQMEILRATWQSDAVGSTNTNITINGTVYPMTQTIATAAPNTGGVQATYYALTVSINGRSLCTYVNGS